MKKITQFLLFSLTLCLSSVFLSADSSKVLTLKGKKGPGQGKTIVLVSGDEEYRTEESMPMLAKIYEGLSITAMRPGITICVGN